MSDNKQLKLRLTNKQRDALLVLLDAVEEQMKALLPNVSERAAAYKAIKKLRSAKLAPKS